MTGNRLILPTQNLVRRYEQAIIAAPNLSCHPDQYLVDTISLMEFDDPALLVEHADKIYERILSAFDSRATATVISGEVFKFGVDYNKLINELDLYRHYSDDPRRQFRYFYKGKVEGDIFMESQVPFHDMRRL